MTQSLAMNRIHSRRGFFSAVAELVRITTTPRPRASATAPFDPELHITPPFALLNGPR
jgi:hypothetical protein